MIEKFNFNHLYIFYLIATEGSLKSAGLTLGLSPSTLSEQLNELELTVGEKLFNRTGRALTLNSRGRFLLDAIQPFFGNVLDTLEVLQSSELSNHPMVEIGLTSEMSKLFAYQLLGPVFKKNGVMVRIKEADSRNLLMDFKNSRLDILVTHEELPKGLVRNVTRLCVLDPKTLVVGSPKFRNLRQGFPKSLDRAPMFLFTIQSPLRWEYERFFKKQKIVPFLKSEVDDIDIIKMALTHDLGISILPEPAIRKELKDKSLIRIGEVNDLKSRVFIYFASGTIESHVKRVLDSFPSA